jgi:molecular chaperone HscB
MNLTDTDFELFDVPAAYAQDVAALDARWKALQREVHPDRFAGQGAAAQRVAMQWSARINEAYQRLRNPLRRAAYLCELKGTPIQAENNTAMPARFLVQQMEWREALEDASTLQAVQALEDEVNGVRQQAQAACGQLLDEAQDYLGAAQQVRALMFIERFRDDIGARLDQLGQ